MIRTLVADVRQAGRRPICVAGFPRSGTTWLSTTLAAAPGVRAYHEPFNPVTVPRAASLSFHYARAGQTDPVFDPLIRDAFAGRVRGPYVGASLRDRYRRHPLWPGRTLVKTVFGILSLERIAALTGARVVVIRRNPLDVAASWHRLGWDPTPHLASIRNQPRLMTDHLLRQDRVIRQANGFWTQFGALWGATHLVLGRSLGRHPEWTTLSFQALCAEPVKAFSELYQRLRLQWTSEQAARVRAATRIASAKPFRPQRIAKRQVGKWRRDGLSPDGLARLRDTLAAFGDGGSHIPGTST